MGPLNLIPTTYHMGKRAWRYKSVNLYKEIPGYEWLCIVKHTVHYEGLQNQKVSGFIKLVCSFFFKCCFNRKNLQQTQNIMGKP